MPPSPAAPQGQAQEGPGQLTFWNTPPSTARLDESFRASSRQADALALVNYREPDEADVKGFSMAFGTTENFWEVLGHEGEEERAQRFNRAMRAVSLNTLDVIPRMYPFDRIRGDGLLVDVGGGLGQVARAIMAAHRGAGLRSCIVQDAHAGDDAKKQPDVMEANRKLGVELQKHNFFDPQPVKGMLQTCPLFFFFPQGSQSPCLVQSTQGD